MCDLKVLQKGIWVALGGLAGHCFGVGREGSHGIENNASKAITNCAYLIDIITLL